MTLPKRLQGVTLQVGVSDLARARAFYDELFGDEPDFAAADDFQEYEAHPGFWFQITTRIRPVNLRRLRFGVADINGVRNAVVAMGCSVSETGELPGVVAWCDFSDPDGNPLGLYQDLVTHPELS
ncbi:MAG TPA: VOC family protein [Nocardioidaceae bacterium]|nr:VOC family protein [Nocardioidaceae bacterium]